jgi:hypothetical protein
LSYHGSGGALLPPCGGGLGWGGSHGGSPPVDPHPRPLPARGRGEEGTRRESMQSKVIALQRRCSPSLFDRSSSMISALTLRVCREAKSLSTPHHLQGMFFRIMPQLCAATTPQRHREHERRRDRSTA